MQPNSHASLSRSRSQTAGIEIAFERARILFSFDFEIGTGGASGHLQCLSTNMDTIFNKNYKCNENTSISTRYRQVQKIKVSYSTRSGKTGIGASLKVMILSQTPPSPSVLVVLFGGSH